MACARAGTLEQSSCKIGCEISCTVGSEGGDPRVEPKPVVLVNQLQS